MHGVHGDHTEAVICMMGESCDKSAPPKYGPEELQHNGPCAFACAPLSSLVFITNTNTNTNTNIHTNTKKIQIKIFDMDFRSLNKIMIVVPCECAFLV